MCKQIGTKTKHEHKVGKNWQKVREKKIEKKYESYSFMFKSQKCAQGQINFAPSHIDEMTTLENLPIVYIFIFFYIYNNWFQSESKRPNNPIIINVTQK